MAKVINQEKINKMISLYEQGYSVTKIGNILNISRQCVSKYIKNNNISVILQPNKIILDESEVLRLYKSGMSITNIASKFNVSSKPITRILKSNSIDTSKNINNKQFICNDDFFEIIDNEYKAYWLGFLYADGCVVTNNGRFDLHIGLSIEDKEHLQLLLHNINSTHPLREKEVKLKGKVYKSCVLKLYSKKLVTDLIIKGCTERKSLTLTFPNEDVLPKHLYKHFIRGYFDGDGSVYYNNHSNKICFSIFGTDNFLSKCFDILNKEIGTSITKLYSKKNCKCKFILKAGKQAIDILDWLYEDSNIYLERKFVKYNNLKMQMPS